MKKFYLFIKVMTLLTFICSYSSAETFQKELSQLNTLNDVTKCLKNHLKPMGEKDARAYCINKNIKKVDELKNVIHGWGEWTEGSNGFYKSFGIKISNLHPNVIFGSIKISINLKPSKSDSGVKKYEKYLGTGQSIELDFNNLFIDEYIKFPEYSSFIYNDISDLNIPNGEISSWTILEGKAIKIANYKNIFMKNDLGNLEKCIKFNSKPKDFFKNGNLLKRVDIKSACLYELSEQDNNIYDKLDLKILKKNEEIAISLENKIDNDFIITAGNLLIELSNCDNKKAKKEGEDSDNIFDKYGTFIEGVTSPGYLMRQFTKHEFEKYLMPGEKFITPFANSDRSMKYCDYKPAIQTVRILSIE